MRKLLVVAGIVAIALPASSGAQGQGALGQAVRRPPPPTGPAPRLPDGTIDLNGVWVGGSSSADIAAGLKPGDTLPLLPSAIAIMESRKNREADDPYLWCLPMGVPRSVPYPWRIVQNYTHKAPTHMFILQEGNIHSYWQMIMEYICQENNQYGIAGGHANPFNK